MVKRFLLGTIGSFLVLMGIVFLFLPGPGVLFIAAGLGLLALEFEWAKDLLRKISRKLKSN